MLAVTVDDILPVRGAQYTSTGNTAGVVLRRTVKEDVAVFRPHRRGSISYSVRFGAAAVQGNGGGSSVDVPPGLHPTRGSVAGGSLWSIRGYLQIVRPRAGCRCLRL